MADTPDPSPPRFYHGPRSYTGTDPTDGDAGTAIRRSATPRTHHALINITTPTRKPEAPVTGCGLLAAFVNGPIGGTGTGVGGGVVAAALP
jgi:hypothetical protein